MWEYVVSDLYRYEGKFSWILFLRNFLFNPSFRFTFFLRMSNSNNWIFSKVSRVFHYHYSVKYSLKIHPSTQIGYGFYIAHGTSIVVNPTAILGNNVSLSQFTSIGSTINKAAIIGDNVYIGPNVSIVNDVEIGDDSTVGAGAVVVKSFGNNSTIAGVPAKLVNKKSDGTLITYKWDVK